MKIKYTKKGTFIIIQNVVIIQNLCKKREKDGAKMELRRDVTINNHPFSYPWPDDNKEGGEFQIFFLHESMSKHPKLVNPYKPWNSKVEEHNQVKS